MPRRVLRLQMLAILIFTAAGRSPPTSFLSLRGGEAAVDPSPISEATGLCSKHNRLRSKRFLRKGEDSTLNCNPKHPCSDNKDRTQLCKEHSTHRALAHLKKKSDGAYACMAKHRCNPVTGSCKLCRKPNSADLSLCSRTVMPKMISRWFPTSLEYEEDTVTLCQNCVNKFDKYCQDISKNITNEYVKKLSGRLMRKLHKSKIDVGTRKLLNKSLLAGALDPEVLGIKAGDGPVTGWVSGLERRCEGDGLSPPQYNISVIRRNFRFLKKLTDGAKRFPVPYRVQVTVGDNLFSKKQQVPHAAYLGYGSPLLKTKLRQKALRLAQKRNRTSSLGFQKKIIRRDFQREFASMAQSQKHYKSIATLVGARHALIGMKGQYGIVFDKPARSALDVLVDDEERDRKAVQAMFRGMNKLGKLQVALDRFIERTKPRVMEFFAPKRAPGGKDA